MNKQNSIYSNDYKQQKKVPLNKKNHLYLFVENNFVLDIKCP